MKIFYFLICITLLTFCLKNGSAQPILFQKNKYEFTLQSTTDWDEFSILKTCQFWNGLLYFLDEEQKCYRAYRGFELVDRINLPKIISSDCHIGDDSLIHCVEAFAPVLRTYSLEGRKMGKTRLKLKEFEGLVNFTHYEAFRNAADNVFQKDSILMVTIPFVAKAREKGMHTIEKTGVIVWREDHKMPAYFLLNGEVDYILNHDNKIYLFPILGLGYSVYNLTSHSFDNVLPCYTHFDLEGSNSGIPFFIDDKIYSYQHVWQNDRWDSYFCERKNPDKVDCLSCIPANSDEYVINYYVHNVEERYFDFIWIPGDNLVKISRCYYELSDD